VLAVTVLDAPTSVTGAAGNRLAAIDVALIDARALEAWTRRYMPSQIAALAVGEVAPVEGNPVEVSKAAAPEAATPVHHVMPLETATVPSSDLAEELPVRHQREMPPPPTQHLLRGGVVARSHDGTIVAPAVAAASPGDVDRYARSVRAALARNKPKGRSARGITTIVFVISTNGTVSAARVSRSSGSDRLDQLVLETVQRTAFPSPPAGMRENQRTYVIPFRFE
jgi:protein TonB